ncbi:MAG: hypothetical protein WCS42_01595 [Verrucomicrobiota bacterium]
MPTDSKCGNPQAEECDGGGFRHWREGHLIEKHAIVDSKDIQRLINLNAKNARCRNPKRGKIIGAPARANQLIIINEQTANRRVVGINPRAISPHIHGNDAEKRNRHAERNDNRAARRGIVGGCHGVSDVTQPLAATGSRQAEIVLETGVRESGAESGVKSSDGTASQARLEVNGGTMGDCDGRKYDYRATYCFDG